MHPLLLWEKVELIQHHHMSRLTYSSLRLRPSDYVQVVIAGSAWFSLPTP